MKQPVISLCMIVKNEASSLPRCLRSVRGVADEIIIIDTGSTDDTVAIARSFGAKVTSFPWSGNFSAARNAGLCKARGTWILFLDADEELASEDKAQLKICAGHLEFEAFFLQVHNHSGETDSSPVATVNPIVRMFRHRPEYRFQGAIHEQIALSILERKPHAAFHITTVKVHHYGYAGSVVASKDKIRRNLKLLEQALSENPDDPFHHYNVAVEYMRMRDWRSALIHLRQSLALSDLGASYRHLIYKYESRCCLELGEYEEAIGTCEQGIAQYPDYTDLYHTKGTVLYAVCRKQEAKDVLLLAMQKGAPPVQYHTDSGSGTYLTAFALGQICEELEEDQDAIHWYEEALHHNRAWTTPLLRLIRILRLTQRENELTTLLSGTLLPKSPEAITVVVKALLDENCVQTANTLLASMSQAEDKAFRAYDSLHASLTSTGIDETSTRILNAYCDERTGEALGLLRSWSSTSLADEESAYKAYRKSRTLLALADIHLNRLSQFLPRCVIYRQVRRNLPLPKIEMEEA
ncbi:TPR domain-containing glycosyltransferase [Paenibacillus sp. RC67]|uniref:glycosyltransferase n=1 Tax=Paenibacillus sp. RC67 TaxID=3039392 RepID=UPI0024AD27F2|nr:TPR domain-containing glycosyltransferase [Paenibacillus sp. RC67]